MILQKIISSWIVNVPRIIDKMNLSLVVAHMGYALKPLYGILMERSCFHDEEKKTTPCIDASNKNKAKKLFKFQDTYTTALKKELVGISQYLREFIFTSDSCPLIYKRINERILISCDFIDECLDILDTYYPNEISSTTEVNDLLFESPVRPARESLAEIIETKDPALILLYSNYINLEIATMECCSDYLTSFQYRWEDIPFIYDISRQIEDEVNHSKILFDEFQSRGGRSPVVEPHFRFWDMTRGEDLATRLYIHQKMGEWIGIDAAIMQATHSNDSKLSEIYTSIVCDEIHHTKLGTYWIDKYADDYQKVKTKALEKRKLFNETDYGPVKFPVNEHICRLCEFKSDEIYDLINRQKEFGVIQRQMKKEIVLATHNQGKVIEFNNVFNDLGINVRLLSLRDIKFDSDIEEIGSSYFENAVLKINAVSAHTDLPILADDSGLEIPKMNDILGVYSARFAGNFASDEENLHKLKELLKKREIHSIEAFYRCCLVYKEPNKVLLSVEADWFGELKPKERGNNGFGYDAIFYLPDGRTSAQLSDSEKSRISHRALAVKKLISLPEVDL